MLESLRGYGDYRNYRGYRPKQIVEFPYVTIETIDPFFLLSLVWVGEVISS